MPFVQGISGQHRCAPCVAVSAAAASALGAGNDGGRLFTDVESFRGIAHESNKQYPCQHGHHAAFQVAPMVQVLHTRFCHVLSVPVPRVSMRDHLESPGYQQGA